MHDRSTIVKAQQMDLIQTLKLVYQTLHPHHSLRSATGLHVNACGKPKPYYQSYIWTRGCTIM